MIDPSVVSVVIPVYRDADRARGAVAAVLDQALPAGMSLEVIVVDDGSGDGTADRMAQLVEPRVRLCAIPENVGRSAARNAGAKEARGAVVVFVDCDCLPVGEHFLSAHLQSLQDAVASTGRVTGDGIGFWSRYQHDASTRRERQHAGGMTYAGSSQNLAVRAAAFATVGGFDIRYRSYGFEDRDLLLRLATRGRVAWATTAEVRHMDTLTLREVSLKLMAAEHSSARFASDHPEAYRALGYAALDARLHGWLRPAGTMAARIAKAAAASIDRTGALERLPYPVARVLTRIVCATAYLAGTATRAERTNR